MSMLCTHVRSLDRMSKPLSRQVPVECGSFKLNSVGHAVTVSDDMRNAKWSETHTKAPPKACKNAPPKCMQSFCMVLHSRGRQCCSTPHHAYRKCGKIRKTRDTSLTSPGPMRYDEVPPQLYAHVQARPDQPNNHWNGNSSSSCMPANCSLHTYSQWIDACKHRSQYYRPHTFRPNQCSVLSQCTPPSESNIQSGTLRVH